MAEQSQPVPGAIASASWRAKFRRFVWDMRANSRFAYLLQISSRVFTSALALVWARLLTQAMGKPLNGLFVAFQSVFSLGGLGDLGMGGAVGIRVGQYLGQGKSHEPEFQKFLASARTLFIVLAVVFAGGMLAFSPWVPHWRNFSIVEGAGSLAKVFEIGAVMVAGVLLFSYVSNLNYACGNVSWPVLPDFLLLQASLLVHLWLAKLQQPLWIQFLPYAATVLVRLWLMWLYVRVSHPQLSALLPLDFDRRLSVNLFESSFWVYICCWANAIYRNTDNLVITKGFPPGTLLDYYYNYRFCELMVFVVSTASFVILPKITQWMSSPDPRDQTRARVEMRRFNQFQILLGCGGALGYLAFNNIFMKIWWHKLDLIAPAALPLQIAFALNMAVTASGDAGLQLALRSNDRGLRLVGMLAGFTGLLNLGLSIVAMKMKSLEGIAMATVLAQAISVSGASLFLCRHLQINWLPWLLKGCIFPLAGIAFAGWLRVIWPMDSFVHVTLLLGTYAVMFLLAAWALDVNVAFIKEEFAIVKKFLVK